MHKSNMLLYYHILLLFVNFGDRKEVKNMSKTTSSRNGNNKKIVPVKPYTKKDGTKVNGHRRSTPN